MSLNDAAWKLLFEKYHILDEIEKSGRFIISAKQIKEFREPRLMTKFDHKTNLPKIFANNGLAILPTTRGDYVISSFHAYKDFEAPATDYQRISAPPYIQSLIPQFLTSEAIALNYASVSGVLEDFLEDTCLAPTVCGRMSSGRFSFDIETKTGFQLVDVNNSQIEIDAAYEGIDCLAIFEAKRDLADDFLIRQLYYPFRTWNDRITKTIKPVFLVFSNGVFNLFQYEFEVPHLYNSLRLVKQKNYIISAEIHLTDIENIVKTCPIVKEPEIAFPQANSMFRVVNLIELLHDKPMTKQDITSEYAFDERQTNYYTDAGRYLGFIEKDKDDDGNVVFSLSTLGQRIMLLEYRQRQLVIATQILSHRAFNETLKLHLRSGEMPKMNTIVRIMKESSLYNINSDTTYERRSSTIVGWVNWILGLVDE